MTMMQAPTIVAELGKMWWERLLLGFSLLIAYAAIAKYLTLAICDFCPHPRHRFLGQTGGGGDGGILQHRQ